MRRKLRFLPIFFVFIFFASQYSLAHAAYRDVIQAESTILNYWPLDNNAGATSTALVGSANMFLSSTTVSTAGQIDGNAVLFNGTSSFGSSTASIDLSSTNKVVIEGIIYLNNWVNADNVGWELSNNINNVTTGFNFSADLAGPNPATTSILLIKGNTGYNYDFFNRPSAGTWHHVVTVFDKSQTSAETKLYIDGVLQSSTSTGSYTNNTNNFGNLPLFLMARSGSSGFLGGKLQHVAVYSDLSAARILAHAQVAGLASTTYTVQASDLWDNVYNNTTDNPRQSNYARFIFTTDAPSIVVTASTSAYSAYPAYAHLGLRIDGVNQSPLVFTANGSKDFTVSLGSPGTTKTIEITNGLQSKPTIVLGSFIDSITYPGTSTLTVSTPTAQTNRILFYGDSITVGGNATNSETASFVPLLRNTYGYSAMIEGWGYRALYDDTNTTPLRTAFVNRVASSSPATMWIPIGSNDYGLNRQSAANYGAAYSTLLDDLHTALPSMRIVCQTPFVRVPEGNNSFSNNLEAYRTQVRTACANRSYATVVEGSSLATTTDLDSDNVHLSTAGHAKYAAGVDRVFTVKPTVTASSTSNASTTGITLNASIDNLGSTTPTDRGFHYGASVSYGSVASSTGSFSTGSFSQTLTDLSCGTIYHYRAFATNFAGTASTTDSTFTTDACPTATTTTVTTSSSSGGGSSASSRISNLISMGNYELAQQIANQYNITIPNVVTTTQPTSFNRTLTVGQKGTDVKALQQYLNSKGFTVSVIGLGSKGNETTMFGSLTRAALARFQKANNIYPPLGFFGPITKAFINSHP